MTSKNIRIEKSLKYSIREGAAASVMSAIGDSYLSAYAIKLFNPTNIQFAFFKSIPQLSSAIIQLSSSTLSEIIGSRKELLSIAYLLQSLIWLPIIVAMFLPFGNIWFLILFVTFYFSLSGIITPVWGSLMGDIVPDKIKGTYFGKRNQITGLFTFSSTILSGLALQYFSQFNVIYGFFLIFLAAGISRLVSRDFLNKLYEAKYVVAEKSKFSFFDFVRKMGSTNYGVFVIYLTLMTFSIQVVAPYFDVYMLRDLKLNFVEYTIIRSVSPVMSFLTIGLWGKYCDKFGSRKIMSINGFLLSLIPISWMIHRNIFYLIFLGAFSGIVWAGFNISTFKFIFDSVSPPKRVRCVSYSNALNGFAVFFGTLLGGYLIKFGIMFWSNIYIIMMISSVLRFFVSSIFIPKIKEVKRAEKISGSELFWNLLTRDVPESLSHPFILLRKRRIEKRGVDIVKLIRKFLKKIE